MKKYDSVIQYYQQNATRIRDDAERIADEAYTPKLLKLHKTYDEGSNEFRLYSHPFRTIRGELLALRLHFIFLEIYLIRSEWWDQTHKRVPTSLQINHMIESLDTNIKRGFLIGVFAVQEHSLRHYIRKIEGEDSDLSKKAYWKIKKYFFDNISFSNEELYNSALRLFSAIRNTIHNDGIYYPPDNSELEINYRGEDFKFIPGEPITFVEWELLLKITEDLADFIFEIVQSDLMDN